MDEYPRNLRTMLADAKDHSELMIDLAYAALFFDDKDMAEEVDDLERDLLDRVHDMREICILAARNVREAEQMSSVLLVVSAIERMSVAATDISRIVTHNLGIPPALLHDLAHAQEVSHRVRVRDDSALAHKSLETLELPTELSMRVVAIKRSKQWMIDPDGDDVIMPDDVLIVRGSPEGISGLRQMAGAPQWNVPPAVDDGALSDLDRAVDVLVEMKDISEVAVGLAYSAILFSDRSLAAEVAHLEDRIDEMREHLEVWILRAASEMLDPSSLRGLLRLGGAAEEIGDAAQQLVWLIERDEEMHPILQISLGESDEVVMRMPVADGSAIADKTLGQVRLEIETGYFLLAIRRSSRYIYRPRSKDTIVAGDELIAIGPGEGREHLAELCGYHFMQDEETGDWELVPIS
ncbi:MAG TPA: TrkA C-terminal domain-containing protein [Acidimicrobiia bacterium]|nr:TrkA C-terminal domain-containing protein [Acidimicrobiia bacterium]